MGESLLRGLNRLAPTIPALAVIGFVVQCAFLFWLQGKFATVDQHKKLESTVESVRASSWTIDDQSEYKRSHDKQRDETIVLMEKQWLLEVRNLANQVATVIERQKRIEDLLLSGRAK